MQDTAGQNVAEVYRYGGSRLLDSGVDRFERTGYGVSSFFGRSSFTVALQRGYDSSPTGGSGVSSSGGFVQERYQTGSEGFFIAKYDGTNDSVGRSRAASPSAVERSSRAPFESNWKTVLRTRSKRTILSVSFSGSARARFMKGRSRTKSHLVRTQRNSPRMNPAVNE